MKLFRALIDLIFPPSCLSCGELIDPKDSFCHVCQSKWKMWLLQRCPKCGHPAPICSCLPRTRKKKSTDRLAYTFFYDSHNEERIGNRLIYRLKQEHDRRLLDFLAARMAESVTSLAYAQGITLSEYRITYPPRARLSVHIHGFDHTALLAKALGKKLGVPVIKPFHRKGNRAQKTLTAGDRYKNALQSYHLAENVSLTGKKILLLDDVITSGATLTVCEALLYTAGAEDVLLCALAKDI